MKATQAASWTTDKQPGNPFILRSDATADEKAWLGISHNTKFLRGLVMLAFDSETQDMIKAELAQKMEDIARRFEREQLEFSRRQRELIETITAIDKATHAMIDEIQDRLQYASNPAERKQLETDLEYLKQTEEYEHEVLNRLENPPRLDDDEMEAFEEQAAEWSDRLLDIRAHLDGFAQGARAVTRGISNVFSHVGSAVNTLAQTTGAAMNAAKSEFRFNHASAAPVAFTLTPLGYDDEDEAKAQPKPKPENEKPGIAAGPSL